MILLLFNSYFCFVLSFLAAFSAAVSDCRCLACLLFCSVLRRFMRLFRIAGVLPSFCFVLSSAVFGGCFGLQVSCLPSFCSVLRRFMRLFRIAGVLPAFCFVLSSAVFVGSL
jgi:hypothetical protein